MLFELYIVFRCHRSLAICRYVFYIFRLYSLFWIILKYEPANAMYLQCNSKSFLVPQYTYNHVYTYTYTCIYISVCSDIWKQRILVTFHQDVPFAPTNWQIHSHSNLEGVWDFVLNHAISPTILTGGQLFLAPPVAPHAWVPQGGTQQKRPGSRKFFVGIQWFWVNFGRFESHLYTSVEVCNTSHVAYHFWGIPESHSKWLSRRDSVIKFWVGWSYGIRSFRSGPCGIVFSYLFHVGGFWSVAMEEM